MPARFIWTALCGLLSLWPALATAEETPPAPANDLAVPKQWERVPDAAKTECPPAPNPEPSSAPLPRPKTDDGDSPPPSTSTTQRVLGWSLLGAAALSTGVAFYFSSEQRKARDAYEELSSGDEAQELSDEHDQAQQGKVVASITAAVFGVVGACFLVSSYGSTAPPSSTAQFSIDPTGMRIGFSGRF